MNLDGRKLWQVGAGDTDRSYGDLCIRYDVMIMGPGEPGPFEESLYADWGDIRNSLRRFCQEANRGDIVLLRLGTGQILAVGEIVDDESQWLDTFSDVDGWDLNHVRRVRWLPDTARTFAPKTLGGQVRTFAAVNVTRVREWVQDLPVEPRHGERDLAELPTPGQILDPEDLGRRLFVEGLPSEHIDNLLTTFSSLQRVASWYHNDTKRPEGRPSEQETVCYLVIPLLLSLGWSQQTTAVQWNFVDVALFSGMPSTDSTLSCVVEAKLLGRSVFSPLGQAREYALRPGRTCDRLIVTDGIRYALHRRQEDEFSLHAYLNILDLRADYPLLGCGGAVDAVLGMAR